MELAEIGNLETVPIQYWTNGFSTKSYSNKKNKSVQELEALITGLVTSNFPELSNCSEKRFLRFQENLSHVLLMYKEVI